ncbi:unnamed protein product [Durusdinium trenchii]|uniref:Copia protein n=1 Tax=Durusdinium trenchii TaxID=1381693 RepID=A0ABP0P7B5_9DINO
MADEEKGSSAWYKVPTWDGNPSIFRTFQREMSWWMTSMDASSCTKYNVAARWTLRQTGIVRARCEEFTPEELAGKTEVRGTDPSSGEEVVLVEADPWFGIRKLMKALEENMERTILDRKDELRRQFYQDLKRNAGERISTFCTRFRTLVSEMRREGIILPSKELGWFLRNRLGLDAIRVQLLDTTLRGRESYEEVEAEPLRFFRDLHSENPLHRKSVTDRSPLLSRFLSQSQSGASSYRTSLPSSGGSSSFGTRSYRSTSVGGSSQKSFRQSPKPPPPRSAMVAEGLADEVLEGEDDEEELIPDQPEANASGLEEVLTAEAEVLAAEIQALEEEGMEPDVLEALECGKQSSIRATISPMREARHKIAEIKKDRGYGKPMSQPAKPRFTRNQPKNSNPKPQKQVRVVEALTTELSADPTAPADEAHEVLTLSRVSRPSTLSEALRQSNEVHVSQLASLSMDKRLMDLVLIWVSIIPVESLGLGLLLGRDWLDGVGCVLSFSKKIMRADGRTFCIAIDPFGDGVVALQIAHHEWLQRKLLAVQFVGNPHHDPKSHEHLLSEHSVCAAKLVGMSVEAGSNSLDLARRMASLNASPNSTTSSSSTPDRDLTLGIAHGRRDRPRKSTGGKVAQQPDAVAIAGTKHGGQWSVAQGSFPKSPDSPKLHGRKFEGVHVASRPPRLAGLVCGRFHASRDAGSSQFKRNRQQDSPAAADKAKKEGKQADAVEYNEKTTVEQLKATIRPVVKLIASKDPPSAKSSSASSHQEPPKGLTTASTRAPETLALAAPSTPGKTAASSPMPGVKLQDIHDLLAQQDQKFQSLEKQFHLDHAKCREVLAVDGAEEEKPEEEGGATMDPYDTESEISSVDEDGAPEARVSSAVRQAVKRLHENTGHRSNRRLARALVLSGAPKEVILAAKTLKCSFCDEKRRPKSHRPTSLPTPKDVSDQVHINIFECSDITEQRFYIVHCIDWTSRFQMAEALEYKDSDSIVHWFQERWMSVFGPPRVIVADQGALVQWCMRERSGTMQYRIALKRHCMMSNDRAPKMLAQTFHHLRRLQWQLIQVPYRQYAKDTANQSVPDVEQAPKQYEIFENILKNATMHPLRAIQLQVEKDKKADGNLAVQDHGSWSGKWPLPTRTSWEAHEISCTLWPCGEHEVNAAKTTRREVKWKDIPMHERAKYRKAAETGWKVQVDNGAFEILSDEESERIKAKLRASGQLHKILTPRYIYTDKHDGLRSDSNPLPLLANARVVIPGYKDETTYCVRKDAPTSSRNSQHMLFIVAAARKWCLWSADVKSAFLKGEHFQEGERELYICNIRCTSVDEPMLPFSAGGLARVRKGVFGLADSIVVSHVDDLLMGGTDLAGKSLRALGDELGFGSLETGCFTYCGKQIKQNADVTIEVNMQAFHENVQPIAVPVHRKKQFEAALTPAEHRQLRAILGSLQWLVTQVRWDMGFHLSVLQGEPPVVKTLLKANALARLMKQDAGFKLRFGQMDLQGAGILVVTDASLGNVTRASGADGPLYTKVFNQAAYLVLVAERNLMSGKQGRFGVLDARSHRLTRVCRSTYGAELLGLKESLDIGFFSRGLLAEVQGFSVLKGDEQYNSFIPLGLVTDAKDVYDKNTSDMPTYGSQKSLAFTVAWMREVLRKDKTQIHWTLTENMLIDCGTKEMKSNHLKAVLHQGTWSITYNPRFVKQTTKPLKAAAPKGLSLPGRLLSADDPMLSHLMRLAERPGWHFQDPHGIHVCRNARSFRGPAPRFNAESFPLRTTYARFDTDHQAEWRILEKDVRGGKLDMIGETADVLVTLFGPDPNPKINKEMDQLKKIA